MLVAHQLQPAVLDADGERRLRRVLHAALLALAVPPAAWGQVIFFVGAMEWSLNSGKITMMSMFEGSKRAPGDFGWDPMGLMTPENEERMKMRELQHARLAMIAIGGMIHGSFVTGTGVFGSTAQRFRKGGLPLEAASNRLYSEEVGPGPGRRWCCC